MKVLCNSWALSLMVLALIASPATSAPAPALDSQACGTTSDHETEEAVCGEGESYFFSDSADLNFANSDAEKEMKNKLRLASGVVCAICEEGPNKGLQCRASVGLGEGSNEGSSATPQANPDDPDERGWKVVKCWTGKYTVGCASCPADAAVVHQHGGE